MILDSAAAADTLCRLLYSTLKREEEEIRGINVDRGRPEHFLLSVSYAGEIAIGYLVRKQALRERVALEAEVRCEPGRGRVDLCLVGDDGSYQASLELKSSGLESTKLLKDDVVRGLIRSVRGVHSDQQYWGWILVTSQPKDALKGFVQGVLNDIADLRDYAVSEAIPVNERPGESHKYSGKSLYAVVFSALPVKASI